MHQTHLERRITLDSLIESSLLGNVLHNSEVKFALWCIWMSFFDLIDLFLGSDRRDYGVSMA